MKKTFFCAYSKHKMELKNETVELDGFIYFKS